MLILQMSEVKLREAKGCRRLPQTLIIPLGHLHDHEQVASLSRAPLPPENSHTELPPRVEPIGKLRPKALYVCRSVNNSY